MYVHVIYIYIYNVNIGNQGLTPRQDLSLGYTLKKLSFPMYWLYFPWKKTCHSWGGLQILSRTPDLPWFTIDFLMRTWKMDTFGFHVQFCNLLVNVGKPTGKHYIPNTQRAQLCSALNPAGSWSHGNLVGSTRATWVGSTHVNTLLQKCP